MVSFSVAHQAGFYSDFLAYVSGLLPILQLLLLTLHRMLTRFLSLLTHFVYIKLTWT